MNDNEFILKQQAAVKRMQEMSARSAYPKSGNQPMPPVPSFVRLQNGGQNRAPQSEQRMAGRPGSETEIKTNAMENRAPQREGGSLFSGLDLPFLGSFQKDGDLSLILGLLLILLSEKADKKLLFALVYILM